MYSVRSLYVHTIALHADSFSILFSNPNSPRQDASNGMNSGLKTIHSDWGPFSDRVETSVLG